MSIQQGKISGDATSFYELFDKFTFIIPDFQRDYEWNLDDLETFFKDVYLQYNRDKPYFFGPILLVGSNMQGALEIVDGQQRLTTVSIFLVAIADLLQSSNDPACQAVANACYQTISEKLSTTWKPKITPYVKYDAFYTDLLQPGNPDTKIQQMKGRLQGREIETNMLFAYEFLSNSLKSKFVDPSGTLDKGSIIKLKENFLSINHFIILKVQVPDRRTSWQIFINLNAKVHDLQISDLIKAVLLHSLPDDQRENYTLRWNDMKTTLEGIKFDQFLHHFFVAHKKPIQEADMWDEIEQNYSTPAKAEQLIKDLSEAAEHYRKCIATEDADFLGNETKIVENLKAFTGPLGIKHHLPALLIGYKKFYLASKQTEFKNLVDIFLKFFVRTRTICGMGPTDLESIATTVCIMIRDDKSINDIKQYLINEQPGAAIFKANFSAKNKYSSKRDWFILSQINEYGYNDARQTLNNLSAGRRSVEHVMPQTLTDSWLNDLKKETGITDNSVITERWKAYLHRWGNLTPMNRWSNSILKNEIFHIKNDHEEGYKQSNASINPDIENYAQDNSQYPDKWWNIDSIKNRTDALGVLAEQIFKVT